MMVIRRSSGEIEHRQFRDLPEYLRPADCLVINKTKVLPARFEAHRQTGGRIEGLFLAEPRPGVWHVLLKGISRLRDDEALILPGTPTSKLILQKRLDRGECEMRLEPPEKVAQILDRIGSMPLPPYIDRRTDATDGEQYQTVYASAPGAVAAPTAGLHFTPALLERIRSVGVRTAEVILHVGLGTFQPIDLDDLAAHIMHSEWYSLPQSSLETIQNAQSAGGRVIAVGTTSVRVLETCSSDATLKAGEGWTNIFIYPPYKFRAVDALITNFHLPGSTLLALVAAWMSKELMQRAYRLAVESQYRFYSYGDAMLIL